MKSDEPPDLYRTVAQLASGQRFLQRYSLTRILGRGGFGVVWLARDDDLQMDVAIKFLSDTIVNNPEAIDDLKRETRYSLRLTHPNIVRIYGFLQSSDLAGVSMEYVDGGTLSALKIDRPNRCFEVDDLGPIVAKLCDALQYAHTRAKVAHRDLKPGNLMVDSSGDLKVADFGISRSISDTQTALTHIAASGTPAYMSPQQMMGERSQITDDIYSLGATIYDLLAGKPPFYQGNVVEQVRESQPISIAARRSDLGISGANIPPHWESVIGACLEKRAEDRPQSAAEVAERLGFQISSHWRDATPLGSARGAGEAGYSTPTSLGTPPDNRLVTPSPSMVLESAQDRAQRIAGRPSSSVGPASASGSGSIPLGASETAAIPRGASVSAAKRVWLGFAIVAIAAAGFFGWKSLSDQSASPDGAADSDLALQQSAETTEQPAGAPPLGDESSGLDAAESEESAQSSSSQNPPGTIESQSQNPGASSGATTPPASDPPRAAEVSEEGADGEADASEPKVQEEPRGPSAAEIVRALEFAIDRREWDAADRQLALLETTFPDMRTDAYEKRIEDERRAAVAESRIPGLIEAGDLALAGTELQALERIHPSDSRLPLWREQIAELKAAREGPARAREEIRALVTEFHDSFAKLDLDRFAALFLDPGATRDEFERAFRDLASQTISIVGEPSIELQGDQATVRLRDHRRQVMKIGRTFESEFDVVLHLEKRESRWKIRQAETKLRQ